MIISVGWGAVYGKPYSNGGGRFRSLHAVLDVGPAIELTNRYQSSDSPMPTP